MLDAEVQLPFGAKAACLGRARNVVVAKLEVERMAESYFLLQPMLINVVDASANGCLSRCPNVAALPGAESLSSLPSAPHPATLEKAPLVGGQRHRGVPGAIATLWPAA